MPKLNIKRLVALVLLFIALVLGGMAGGLPAFSSHGGQAAVSVAYADGCDGPHPPPGLDCPATPTPTPPDSH